MVDGDDFLAINREALSADIDDLEFNPHAEFKGAFKVLKDSNEKACLQRFFAEVRLAAPTVIAKFNSDYFHSPFVENRAAVLAVDMGDDIATRTYETDTRAMY